MNSDVSLSYRDSGVDIDAGNALVERIKPAIKATRRPGCVGSIGGFGGLFELPLDRYRQPVLVSGTDGVGTKLKLAIEWQRYDGIGIDPRYHRRIFEKFSSSKLPRPSSTA